VQLDRSGLELPFAEQVSLVFTQMLPVQLVGRFSEVLGEPFHRTDVVPYRTRSVISPLEFLQHYFA
jgi:hypothetical protein